MHKLTAEQQEKLELEVSWTFYGWLFCSLAVLLLVLPFLRSSWLGVLIALFCAFALAFFAAMIRTMAGVPASENFWAVPVKLVDDEHETLMADEIIRRHAEEEKKKKKLKRALNH